MIIECPACTREVDPQDSEHCPHCQCEIGLLGRLLTAAEDSLLLAMEALRERNLRDALDYAYEAWSLKQTVETAAVGLLAATALRDGTETMRWLRRRQRLNQAES
jgi:hypothetical protein